MTLKLHFLHLNSDILRGINEKITVFDKELRLLAQEMTQLMHDSGGVGLAAPQAGLNKLLFVWSWDGKDFAAINPTLKTNPKYPSVAIEGCLSVPKKSFEVVRDQAAHLKAYDMWGARYEIDAIDYQARILQHENDHLKQILIPDIGKETLL